MTAQSSSSMHSVLKVRELGVCDYVPVWQAMKKFTENRTQNTVDELWVLQHPPVFTQGQAGKPEHLLFTGDIPVVQVDRGGQVTYHGPGQLVAYFLFDIRRLDIGPREFVSRIEQVLVDLLASYHIDAHPRKDAPGVYVNDDLERKIASLGLRIRKGCSFHGLALNVDMDLEPFQRINPCGYQGMQMAQMNEYCSGLLMDDISDRLITQVKERFNFTDTLVSQSLPSH